jgi:hypothetical protein
MTGSTEAKIGPAESGTSEVDEATIRAFERPAEGGPWDETDVNLRGYIARIPRDKLEEYDPAWTDEQVMRWDGNFREDGDLMLVCCERDVDVEEFREVFEMWMDHARGLFGFAPFSG